MKKSIFFLFLLLLGITNAKAQYSLYVTNNSCADVYVVIYADDNSGCNLTYKSNVITFPTTGSVEQFDFTSNVTPTGSALWNGWNGLVPISTPINIVKAEVYVIAWPTSPNFGCQYILDGVAVYNPGYGSDPSCGMPQTDTFEPSGATSPGNCDWCHVTGTAPNFINHVGTPITPTFSRNATGDWVLTIN